MKHLPIYLNLDGQQVVVSGVGSAAAAKLRILVRTRAQITVFGAFPDTALRDWMQSGRINWIPRPANLNDIKGAALLYCANEDPVEDQRIADMGKSLGIPFNIVDNLENSRFITPALVDRDPVTIAIGTEGAAPMLASGLRAALEEALPGSLGTLAKIGQKLRPQAGNLPKGWSRRIFWSDFYFRRGPHALARGNTQQAERSLQALLDETASTPEAAGRVSFVGAGPGDPELLTLKARNRLREADVVIHDRLVSDGVLEIARREARMILTGKTGFRPSWKQEDISRLMIEQAQAGQHVVRLKSGDPTIFGRLDEEIDALDCSGVDWEIIPGITAATAAATALGVSLTRRERNAAIRFVTGHEATGFAHHDWKELAAAGAVTAVYMGKRAASHLRGCLLMHGASPATPVAIVENASHANQRTVSTNLLNLPDAFDSDEAPAVILIGVTPRVSSEAVGAPDSIEKQAI